MAGHAVRWKELVLMWIYRSQKSKNPDNLFNFGEYEKITGAHLNRIANIQLCGEYSYMPGKVQDFFLCRSFCAL